MAALWVLPHEPSLFCLERSQPSALITAWSQSASPPASRRRLSRSCWVQRLRRLSGRPARNIWAPPPPKPIPLPLPMPRPWPLPKPPPLPSPPRPPETPPVNELSELFSPKLSPGSGRAYEAAPATATRLVAELGVMVAIRFFLTSYCGPRWPPPPPPPPPGRKSTFLSGSMMVEKTQNIPTIRMPRWIRMANDNEPPPTLRQ